MQETQVSPLGRDTSPGGWDVGVTHPCPGGLDKSVKLEATGSGTGIAHLGGRQQE